MGVKSMEVDILEACNRRGDSGQKLEHSNIHTNTRKNLFTARVMVHRKRLPREVVESPSLEIFKTHLDTFLCNILQGTALAGGRTQRPPEVPSDPSDSLIL